MNDNVKQCPHSYDLTQDLWSFLFLSFRLFPSLDNTMSCPSKHEKGLLVEQGKGLQTQYHYSLSKWDQLLLLDHNIKPILSSCSENHCGKCALILLSLK